MTGNKTLDVLIEAVGQYSFPAKYYGTGPRVILRLRHAILKEMTGSRPRLLDMYSSAILDDKVQEILGLTMPTTKSPKVVDLTEILELEHGTVYGLSLPDLSLFDSFKYAVVSGLFLMRILSGDIPQKGSIMVDCGVKNSAEAVFNLTQKFDLEARYYISANIPLRIRRDLAIVGLNVVPVTETPNLHHTNIAYKKMIESLNGDSTYLGHSELGWLAMMPIVKAYCNVISQLGIKPEVLCSPVGAGTFFVPFVLSGFAEENYLLEYSESAVMTGLHNLKISSLPQEASIPIPEICSYPFDTHKKARLNISRRFEDNPYIPKEFWRRVDGSILFGPDFDYPYVCKFIDSYGLTTSGPIGVAAYLAEMKNKTVIVPIFENRFVNYAR